MLAPILTCMISYCILIVWLVCEVSLVAGRPGVADPVKPCYNHSMFPSFFERPQIPDDLYDLRELSERGAFGYHKLCMLSNTQFPFHKINKLFVGYDAQEISGQTNYLSGTTYWLNEYMHVGHVHYDIGLLQVLATTKLDRIVIQRAVCHEKLCHGIGPIESFYKGFLQLHEKPPIKVIFLCTCATILMIRSGNLCISRHTRLPCFKPSRRRSSPTALKTSNGDFFQSRRHFSMKP